MKTKKILTIIVIAILVIGGILYFDTRKSSVVSKLHTEPSTLIQNPENISTTTEISTISIPPLPPFMDWTLATSTSIWSQKVIFGSETFTNSSPSLSISIRTIPLNMKTQDSTVPAKTWISVVSDQDASNNKFYNNFHDYYDSILTKDGWSQNIINLPNATIYGVDAGGVFANYWSYLKIAGDNLYMIELGYSGPTYEVSVSDPIPLKQLGL